jgi:CRISPR-associated protein Csm1
MLNQLEYQTVILAALLHDIGKFLQWSSLTKTGDFEKHPQISEKFVSDYSECFNKVSNLQLLKTLIGKHHNSPDSPPDLSVQSIEDPHTRSVAYLVSKADNLSSGERGEHAEQWQDYKATPLMCVLERLNHETDEHLKLRYHPQPLGSVQSLSGIFPEQFKEFAPGELNKHLKSFGDEFIDLFTPKGKSRKPVNNADFDTFLAHLTSLIYRYTSCIPSDTQGKIPDVSLFDHLETTAAIATCLYRYHAERDSLTEKTLASPKEPRFCLAVGDISGIQRYIFDIAQVAVGGGVARRLRARSLYVQLCSEVAAHIILRRLKLPMLNMIMNSGGKFYLLLPNLPETVAALEQVQQHVDEWFLTQLNGELTLNLAHTIFDEEGFEVGSSESGFGAVLKRTSDNLNKRKLNTLSSTIIYNGKWQEDKFLIKTSFEGKSACRSCRKFPATQDELCIHCDRDSRTGSKLTRAKYIAFYDKADTGSIPVAGYSVSVEADLKDLAPSPYLVLKLNDTDMPELNAYPSITKYLTAHVAADEKSGTPATFEDIAQNSKGAGLLGFLKADVDNLGQTFAFGLKRSKDSIDTISRIATASRMLDLFFSGWVENLLNTKFKNCYTIFSGGDDLFIVGPWNEMPRLAELIRVDLDRYSGNPKITMSAGVLIAKPGFPIARAASAADDILKLSKKEPKDKLTILNHTRPWTDWQLVKQEWDTLEKLISEDKVTKSKVSSAFLYNLLRYGRMYQNYVKGDVMGLRYQPLLAYDITRNLDARKSPELYQWANALLKIPVEPKQETILNNLGLIASLLIYSRRGGRE